MLAGYARRTRICFFHLSFLPRTFFVPPPFLYVLDGSGLQYTNLSRNIVIFCSQHLLQNVLIVRTIVVYTLRNILPGSSPSSRGRLSVLQACRVKHASEHTHPLTMCFLQADYRDSWEGRCETNAEEMLLTAVCRGSR